jgi:Uma2 family endonuclease
LNALLFNFLQKTNLGVTIISPVDVYLESLNSVVQPDLLVILNESLDQIKKDGIYGAPTIVIEILSKNKLYDTQRKRALYEKAGVREYFMIDPENKVTTLLTLNAKGVYEQTYEAAGTLRSDILDCNIGF